MNNSQQILVTQQLILAGPLCIKEAYPQISLPVAIAIMLFAMVLIAKKFITKPPCSLFALAGRIITSWALASFSMILASYLAA